MNKIDLTFYDQNVWGWGYLSGDNRINNRNFGIKALILAYDADIVCFQECSPTAIRGRDSGIGILLAGAYEEVSVKTEGNNFTPVFYKKDRFAVVECGFHLYEGKNDVDSKSITWAVMEEKRSGVRFGVCSTHFWWKSDDESDDLQRMENAAVLYKLIEDLRVRYEVPVFAMGDLNCLETSGPYRWLSERLLDARRHADKTTDTLTNHGYPWCDENKVYHATFEAPKNTIDYFFVTEDPRVQLCSFAVDDSAVALSTSDHSPLIVRTELGG